MFKSRSRRNRNARKAATPIDVTSEDATASTIVPEELFSKKKNRSSKKKEKKAKNTTILSFETEQPISSSNGLRRAELKAHSQTSSPGTPDEGKKSAPIYTKKYLEELKKDMKALPSQSKASPGTGDAFSSKLMSGALLTQDSFNEDGTSFTRTRIPTFSEIEKAKQKKEQLRSGFIPLNLKDQEVAIVSEEHEGSTLIREDPDDVEEWEQEEYKGSKIAFGDHGKYNSKNAFQEAKEELLEAEDDPLERDEEMARWELDLMRKGGAGKQMRLLQESEKKRSELLRRKRKEEELTQYFSGKEGSAVPTVEQLSVSLSQALSNLLLEKKSSQDKLLALDLELKETQTNYSETLVARSSAAADKFEFLSEFRGFAETLMDCLDEKKKEIELLREEVDSFFTRKHSAVAQERAREREEGLADALGLPIHLKVEKELDEFGRDLESKEAFLLEKRRKRRNLRAATHQAKRDRGLLLSPLGYSSDEEEEEQITEGEATAAVGEGLARPAGQQRVPGLLQEKEERFEREVEALEVKCSQIWSDVHHSFSSLSSVQNRFTLFSNKYHKEYYAGFMGYSLQEIYAVFGASQLLLWDPLSGQSFQDLEWYRLAHALEKQEQQRLSSATAKLAAEGKPTSVGATTAATTGEKSDAQATREAVQRQHTQEKQFELRQLLVGCVLPLVEKAALKHYDPTSTAQTKALVSVLSSFGQLFGVNAPKAASDFVINFYDKLQKVTKEHGLFPPALAPKLVSLPKTALTLQLTQKALWSACKLLQNLSAWRFLLSAPISRMLLNQFISETILPTLKTMPVEFIKQFLEKLASFLAEDSLRVVKSQLNL